MGSGALDAVKTPAFSVSGNETGGADLLAKIAMLAKLIGKPSRRPRLKTPHPAASGHRQPGLPLVAIGASTGGPKALSQILTKLPPDLPAAIAIVQHVDEFFAPGLASWLAREASRPVRVIRQNDQPDASVVQIASTNDHLLLKPDLTFAYTCNPMTHNYRPSVDIFFDSIVKHWPSAAVGVLLTGMGADGATGLLAMRKAGWHTIAQDQSTSTVYGMPKAAARLNAATEILPLDEIAEAIARAVNAVSADHQRKQG
jgi:chemotaxis response regulator CheB